MTGDWPALPLSEAYRRLCAPGAPFETRRADGPHGACRVYRHAPASLREVFEQSQRFAERTFIVFEDERLSFGAHARAVVALAQRLSREMGCGHGDRVVIAMRNWPQWSIAFWATVSLGAVAVPLNAWGTRAELERDIASSAPRVAIVDHERHERLGLASADALGVKALVVVRAERDTPGSVRLESLIGPQSRYAELPDSALPGAAIAPDDAATILFTSGTASTPKPVLATHRNILSNLMSRRFGLARAALRRGDPLPDGETTAGVLLAPVPLFHVTGCHSYLVPSLASGDTLVMLYRWSPERALELIERERVTTVGGVPTMLVQLLSCPQFAPERCASVRAMVCGGAASGRALLQRIHAALPGVTTGNGYGMTESCSLISQNTAEDHLNRPDSAGPVVPVCELRVVDEHGQDVRAGERGELWVRGANVVNGYWRDPAASRERFIDGWLRTGDLGYVDDEGFLYIVDRIKDLVIRGGENIACGEVENVLLSHPEVVESAVFGLAHDELGEEVAAVVQVRNGFSGDADALRAHVAGVLAAFKVPRWIDVRREPLPRNAAGKVLKRELVAQAHSRRRPLVD